MTEIGRPPVLAVGHQGEDVPLDRRQVEALELGGIIEAPGHRIVRRRILVQHRQVQLVRPPQPVRHLEQNRLAAHIAALHRTLALLVHQTLLGRRTG